MDDKQFVAELDTFRTEHESAIQFFYAYLALYDAAARHFHFQQFLNRNAMWWNTCLGSLQTATIISLGRIFDQNSTHNLDSFLRLSCDEAKTLFSKTSLENRILQNGPERPPWLDAIVSDAYEPTSEDFRLIRKLAGVQRRIYEDNYRDLRHLWFAHKVVSDPSVLFAKTNIGELKRMLGFLASLYQQFWSLFFNGTALRPTDLLKNTVEGPGSRIEEDVKSFVKHVLEFAPKTSAPPLAE
jgi:hypothetical protein